MYTLISSDKRTASKAHTCIWCGQKIIAGAKYTEERGIYGGDIQRYWHPECYDDGAKCYQFTPWENQRPALLNTQAKTNPLEQP